MAAPSLFDAPVDNHGLFADHYLKTRFPQRDDVQALREEADAAFEQVRDRYQSVAGEVDTWNEAQTEDRFVQPVLKEVLGWARKVQPHVQRQGQVGRPDYALFTTDARRSTAVEHAGGDETKVFDYADAVAEAKYWGRPLDGPAPDPEREETNMCMMVRSFRIQVYNQARRNAVADHLIGQAEEAPLFGPGQPVDGFLRRQPREGVVLVVEHGIGGTRGGEGRNQVDAVVLPFVEGIQGRNCPEPIRGVAGLFGRLAARCFPRRLAGLDFAAHHAPLPGVLGAGGAAKNQKLGIYGLLAVGIHVDNADGGVGHGTEETEECSCSGKNRRRRGECRWRSRGENGRGCRSRSRLTS